MIIRRRSSWRTVVVSLELVLLCIAVRSASATHVTFSNAHSYAIGNKAGAIATADLNGDGSVDLAVASPSSGTVSLLTNDGLGSFLSAATMQIGTSPTALAAADLDRDGITDLVVGTSGTLLIFCGKGAGAFETSGSIPLPSIPYNLQVADFNRDGFPDLVAWLKLGDGFSDADAVWVLLGIGGGRFEPSFQISRSFAHVPGVADFNGDGLLDLLITGGSQEVQLYTGDSTGNFTPQTSTEFPFIPYYWSSSVWDTGIGDFNGDGSPDVCAILLGCPESIFAPCSLDGRYVLLNDGNGHFVDPQAPPASPPSSTHRLTSLAEEASWHSEWIDDVDGDGRADVGWANWDHKDFLTINLSDGSGTFPDSVYVDGQTLGSLFADVNGDQKPDLIRTVTNGFSISLNTMACFGKANCGDTYTITVKGDMTLGEVSGTGNYQYGEVARIQAVPRRGYKFDHWRTDGWINLYSNPYIYPARDNRTFVAVYTSDDSPVISDLTAQWRLVRVIHPRHRHALLNVKLSVQNIGTQASGTFATRCYLSTDRVQSTDDLLLDNRLLGPVNPGEIVPLNFKTRVLKSDLGSSPTLYAIIDSDNQVAEFSEDDNILSCSLVVRR